eukprot:1152332-Pelagomonas_calceolata.AAC.18
MQTLHAQLTKCTLNFTLIYTNFVCVKPQLEPIAMSDVDAALSVTKPSARLLEQQYKKFSDEFGQSGT